MTMRKQKKIRKAEEEFFDRIWYDRKLVMFENIKEGKETIDKETKKTVVDLMKKLEVKYGGRRAMRNYCKDDFGWGMMCGKLSAIRWVLGDEWDDLDT